MTRFEVLMLGLAIVPVAYYLYREVGVRIIRAYEIKRQLRSYLEAMCSDPDIHFHTESSTLPIPFKDLEGVDHNDIHHTLLEQLRTDRLGWTLLVGELGAGKTATLSLLFVKIAKLYLAGDISAVPVFIRLREGWNPDDVEASLDRYVDLKPLRRIMNGKLRLVLLLDSADEFAMRYGHPLALRQLSDIVLGAPFLKKCIVIVSTRPNVIPDLDRQQSFRDVFSHQYRLLDLQYTDVEAYIRKKGLEQTFRELSRDLRRLIAKPLFLYFFVTASQGTTPRGRKPVEVTDEAQLYDWFFDEWYARAQVQMGLGNPLPEIGVMRAMMELFAVAIASSANGSLEEKQIRQMAAQLVDDNPHLGLFLNRVLEQATERWLLVPHFDGEQRGFRFIHPSLADYFLSGPLAIFFLSSKLTGGPQLSQFGELVLLFVKARLSKETSLAQLVRARVAGLKAAPVGADDVLTAISVILWLEHGAAALELGNDELLWLQQEWKRLENNAEKAVAVRAALRRVRLPKAHVEEVFLNGYDLSHNSDFSEATLTRCTFVGGSSRFKLSSATFECATLRGCKFVGVDLLNVAFTGATLESCQFESCVLHGARSSHAVFDHCRFSSCDLTGADFSQGTADGGEFESCPLNGAIMDNFKSRGLTMRECNLYQLSVTGFPKSSVKLYDCRNIPPQW